MLQFIEKRRLVLLALVFLLFLPSRELTQTRKAPHAKILVAGALKVARKEGKAVMLDFGASWCKWCHHLEAALHSPELEPFFKENFVIVNLTIQETDDKKDLENPGADDLLAEIQASDSGIPVIIVLDKDGKRIGHSLVMPKEGNIGYPVTVEEIQAFVGLLEKTAPRMTASHRALVLDWLTTHAPKVE